MNRSTGPDGEPVPESDSEQRAVVDATDQEVNSMKFTTWRVENTNIDSSREAIWQRRMGVPKASESIAACK